MRLLGEARGLLTVRGHRARYRSPAAQGLTAVGILIAVIGYMATNLLLGIVIDAIFRTGLAAGIWINDDHSRVFGGRQNPRGDLYRRFGAR